MYGATREKWRELGQETQVLRYPVKEEHDHEGGGMRRFQGGDITWTAEGGAVEHDPFGDFRPFDTGYPASDLLLGGSAHLIAHRNGDFNFSCHAHDSGFNNIS